MRNLPTLAGRRVVIVTPNLSLVGGTEVYLQRLLRAQQSLGIDVRVVTAARVAPAPNGVEVIPCPEVFADSNSSRPALALADELIAWADWVEFHHDAPPALLYALKNRLPSLLFMHTARYTCAAKSRYLPRSGGCCAELPGLACWRNQWRQGCLTTIDGRPSMQELFKAAALRRSSRALAAAATKVVFNSNALRQLFERTIDHIGDRARILPPPMLMPEHQPARRGGDLLYLGRFFEQKGIDDAVRVAAALTGKRLNLYGSGRGEQAARRLAGELNADVRFHGWGDAATVALALAEAGCLLLPTRLFEAWGMVGPEAIAQGCPVAAYDSGGIREWLTPEYGEIVPQGDLPALIAATRRQLARVEAGLDTSGWRQAIERRWGLPAFTERYAYLAAEVIER